MSQPSPQTAPVRSYGVYLGRFLGIRFYLDYSWFLIAAVVIYTLSTGYFAPNLRGSPWPVPYVLGTFSAVLFFLSILLHELGHSVVSQRCGIPVPRITLLFIGGIAEISREPDTARSELKIAIAGPLVSAGLALCYWLLNLVLRRAGWMEAALVF